ncbi:MAG: Arc family DNA-binding protein [Clostridiales bacterium]
MNGAYTAGGGANKDKEKKQILLRLSPSLWQDLAQWAEEDFRSINGQIEFLLTECVRKRKKEKNT